VDCNPGHIFYGGSQAYLGRLRQGETFKGRKEKYMQVVLKQKFPGCPGSSEQCELALVG
jgi:hypothetical protein